MCPAARGGRSPLWTRGPELAVKPWRSSTSLARPVKMFASSPNRPGLSALTRALIDRCTGSIRPSILQLELARMPHDAGAVAAATTAIDRELRAAGTVPAMEVALATPPGVVVLRT
jgi:hypothetical protein